MRNFEKVFIAGDSCPSPFLRVSGKGIKVGGGYMNIEGVRRQIQKIHDGMDQDKEIIRWLEKAIDVYKDEFGEHAGLAIAPMRVYLIKPFHEGEKLLYTNIGTYQIDPDGMTELMIQGTTYKVKPLETP